MYTFIVPPESSAYSMQDIPETIYNQLDGGKGRFRQDILNSYKIVNVQWIFNPEEYTYFRSFYRYFTNNPSEAFLISLVIDQGELTEHEARFIPRTVSLQSQMGQAYTVVAQLEVKPLTYPAVLDEDILDMVEAFGLDWQIDEEAFNHIINEVFPLYLDGTLP